MLGNMKFISRVEQDISLVRYPVQHVYTRNKFHISAHPCIILYLILNVLWDIIFDWISISFKDND